MTTRDRFAGILSRLKALRREGLSIVGQGAATTEQRAQAQSRQNRPTRKHVLLPRSHPGEQPTNQAPAHEFSRALAPPARSKSAKSKRPARGAAAAPASGREPCQTVSRACGVAPDPAGSDRTNRTQQLGPSRPD